MEINNNKRGFRFEGALPGGEMATLEYRWLKGSMVLMHTLIPQAQRGHGYGDILIKYVLDHARSHSLKIIVYCPFVAKYMETHTGYDDLVDKTYRH